MAVSPPYDAMGNTFFQFSLQKTRVFEHLDHEVLLTTYCSLWCFQDLSFSAKPLSQSMLKQVSNLYWNQLDQIQEVHQFASVLDKPTGEIDRNLEALQTRCISQPQLVAPVTELRELVNLLRRRGDFLT